MDTFNINANGVITNPNRDIILDIQSIYRLEITYAEIDGIFHFGHNCSSNIKGIGFSRSAAPCIVFREYDTLEAAKAYVIDIELKDLQFWKERKNAKCDNIITKLKDIRNSLIFKQLTIF